MSEKEHVHQTPTPGAVAPVPPTAEVSDRGSIEAVYQDQVPAELQSVSRLFSNMGGETMLDRLRLMSIYGQPTIKDEQRLNGYHTIVGYAIHPVEAADPKTGEVRQWLRTVLVTKSGETMAFGSFGVARSIATMARILHPSDWHHGIPVHVISGRAANGGRWYALEIATPTGIDGPGEDTSPKRSRPK